MKNLALATALFVGLTAFRADKPVPDVRRHAVLWFATAAESEACFLQGYAAAEAQLRARGPANGRQVVVTDLDETAINNGAASAVDIQDGITDFKPERWLAWEEKGRAAALPGAVDFFKQADALGYRICYLSNRSVKHTAATLRNLRELGFPQVDTSHIAFRKNTSSKEARRQALRAQGYEIVMLLGDNLTDFLELPKTATEAQRADSVRAHRADWGRRFIVFPNPMYGSWEDALVSGAADKEAALEQRMKILAQPAR